eukprot:2024948-Pleurochrysis_carterae.AAC.1
MSLASSGTQAALIFAVSAAGLAAAAPPPLQLAHWPPALFEQDPKRHAHAHGSSSARSAPDSRAHR